MRMARRWELALLQLADNPEENVEKALLVTAEAIENINSLLEREQEIFFDTSRPPEEVQQNGNDDGERLRQEEPAS
jgi:hypothetical protein